MSKATARAPRRCFIIDLPRLLLSPSTNKSYDATTALSSASSAAPSLVRLMGTVVSMSKVVPPSQPQSQSQCYAHDENEMALDSSFPHYDDAHHHQQQQLESSMLLELDDGTGIVSCLTPMAMMERITGLRVGHTVDCIGEPRVMSDENQDNTLLSSSQAPSSATVLLLMVETLLEVRQNPSSAERLRWMEIMTLSSQATTAETHNNTRNNHHSIAWCGYPSPAMTPADLLAVIESTITTTTNSAKQPTDDRGVTVANLALVLDLDPTHLQALIEDLQLDGLIYENEKGSFVPL